MVAPLGVLSRNSVLVTDQVARLVGHRPAAVAVAGAERGSRLQVDEPQRAHIGVLVDLHPREDHGTGLGVHRRRRNARHEGGGGCQHEHAQTPQVHGRLLGARPRFSLRTSRGAPHRKGQGHLATSRYGIVTT